MSKKRETRKEAELKLQKIIISFNKGEIKNGKMSGLYFKEILKEETPFLDKKLSYTPIKSQRLWHILNNKKEIPSCRECGGEVSFASLTKGYLETCSYKCGFGQHRLLKTKKTNIEKYGFENVFQNEEIKEKMKQTNLERYGFISPGENIEIQEKVKQTNLERYGSISPAGNKEVMDKMEKTCLERYGETHYNKTKESKTRRKKTNLEKYGVEHASQNAETFEKIQKKRFKRKEYIMPSGKIYSLQGYENFTLDLLLKTHTEEDLVIKCKEIENFIGRIWYTGEDNKEHRYFPDLYCISENKIYETKSDYTFSKEYNENMLKMSATKNMGIEFVFNIFNTKHQLLNEQELIQKRKPE